MASEMTMVNWDRQRCKGYIQTWVARPKQPLQTVAATVQTIARKHSIPATELSAMLREVREQSVDPFFGPPFHLGPERQGRLDELVDDLRRKGVL